MENKIFSYKEAFESSKKYFNDDEFAAKVFVDKYVLRDREQNILENSPEMMFHRVASELHRIEEKKFKKPLSYEKIYSYLEGFKRIIPQGSPLSGIGNPYQYVTLSNCYVIDSPLDSYASICRADEELVQISKRRGGCGLDISNLRPDGSPTTNAARTSTGIIPFMERYSNSIREVGQSGRRGALLISLSIHHPEVLNFISAKKDVKRITGANISVKLSDEFLKAVKEDKKYEQRWPVDADKPVMSEKVNARDIWMEIIKNAHNSAEPGLLFWDNIIRESPADCYKEFGFETISTNPCSELPISAYDSCRLLLLNLYGYIDNPFTRNAEFNFDKFYEDAKVAQRFMDDIIDLEIECIDRIIKKIKNDPEPIEIKRNELDLWKKMKEACLNGRRTGTGITALGDTIAACGYKYGSEKSIELADDIYRTLKLACYRSSVDMAKELGPFKVWNHELERKNPFLKRIKKEDRELWEDMKKYGRRNISLLTSAPAGTVSVLAQTTSGIEPVFQIQYIRRKKVNPNDKEVKVDFVDQNGDTWQEFNVYHPKVKEWMKITGKEDIEKSPWFNACAEEINWQNRVKLQATANRHVDHSISSTVNLPEDISVEEVAKIYEAAWEQGCKGITIYRKNCRTGVLVDDNDEKRIKKNHAPKRPKELIAEVFHTSVKGESYFVIVGLFYSDPYEVFAGKNGEISRSLKQVKIKKLRRGTYSLCDVNTGEVLHKDISKYVTEDQEAITRLLSSNLRHGCEVGFIVHQLEKTTGDLQSFAKAVARVLKKYIPENYKVSGEECPNCQAELRRSEGCLLCASCGFTKCS